MNDRHYVIINGLPGCGKDTFANAVIRQICRMTERICCRNVSSIDPVRELMLKAGIDVKAKTPEDRALLSEVGMALEKHSFWRSRRTVEIALTTKYAFIHVREPEIITRITDMILEREPHADVTSLFVIRRDHDPVLSNESDRGVSRHVYDVTLINGHGVQELEELAQQVARDIVEGSFVGFYTTSNVPSQRRS